MTSCGESSVGRVLLVTGGVGTTRREVDFSRPLHPTPSLRPLSPWWWRGSLPTILPRETYVFYDIPSLNSLCRPGSQRYHRRLSTPKDISKDLSQIQGHTLKKKKKKLKLFGTDEV